MNPRHEQPNTPTEPITDLAPSLAADVHPTSTLTRG